MGVTDDESSTSVEVPFGDGDSADRACKGPCDVWLFTKKDYYRDSTGVMSSHCSGPMTSRKSLDFSRARAARLTVERA
jgi:hypothetical protein